MQELLSINKSDIFTTKYRKNFSDVIDLNPDFLKKRTLKELLETKSLPIFVKGRKIKNDRLDVYDFLNIISLRREQIPNRYWDLSTQEPELLVAKDVESVTGKKLLVTKFVLVGKTGSNCNIIAYTEEDQGHWRREEVYQADGYHDNYECDINEFIKMLAESRISRDDTSRIKEMYILIKDNLRLEDLLFTNNMEIRSELIKRLGFDGISEHAKIIDTWNDYVLFDIVYTDVEFGRYMKMVDSTSKQTYLLRVPTNRDFGRLKIPIDTCKKALAWSFKMQEKDYKPEIET